MSHRAGHDGGSSRGSGRHRNRRHRRAATRRGPVGAAAAILLVLGAVLESVLGVTRAAARGLGRGGAGCGAHRPALVQHEADEGGCDSRSRQAGRRLSRRARHARMAKLQVGASARQGQAGPATGAHDAIPAHRVPAPHAHPPATMARPAHTPTTAHTHTAMPPPPPLLATPAGGGGVAATGVVGGGGDPGLVGCRQGGGARQVAQRAESRPGPGRNSATRCPGQQQRRHSGSRAPGLMCASGVPLGQGGAGPQPGGAAHPPGRGWRRACLRACLPSPPGPSCWWRWPRSAGWQACTRGSGGRGAVHATASGLSNLLAGLGQGGHRPRANWQCVWG